MRKIIKIGSAFIGIVVGAGFASGQEILQYFTSCGYLGTAGAIVATILFAYLGMTLTKLGSRTQTTSHKTVIYQISSRYLGVIVDYVIIFSLCIIGFVLIDGAGAILQQRFGLPSLMGSLIMGFLVIVTVMLNVQRVISGIGSLTPLLILPCVLT